MKYRGGITINDFCFLRLEPSGQFNAVLKTAAEMKQYAKGVLAALRAIDGNPCGRILFDAISHHGGGNTIEISGMELKPGEDKNALTLGDPDAHRAPGKATPQQVAENKYSKGVVRDQFGNPIRNPDPNKWDPVVERNLEDVLGKGKGSMVRLLFTPGHWTGCKLAGARADIVLFHELVHAYRFVRGRMNRIPMSLLPGEKTNDPARLKQLRINRVGSYPNREEFFAVVLENIYQSCLGNGAPLRGEYAAPANPQNTWNVPDSGARQTSGSLRTGNTRSETVMLENLGAITQLYEEERPFLAKIIVLPGTFNPFRDYARKYGQGKAAYAANWH